LRILAKERFTVMLIPHDVEEALQLADRILLLSPRPTRIKAVFSVPFPHPRRVSSNELPQMRVAIPHELGVGRGDLGCWPRGATKVSGGNAAARTACVVLTTNFHLHSFSRYDP
jgi:hypothetical protein